MTEHTTEDQLIEARREKHRQALAAGGYPYRFERTDMASDLHERHAGLEPGSETSDRVAVAGRLMLHRSFGKLQFGTLRDGSGTIQLVVDQSIAGEDLAAAFASFDLGDWVGASGTVMTTRKGELSVRVEHMALLQKSLRPLPDKWHGLADIEMRSRRRYLDLMVNEDARRVALTRSKLVSALRREFEARGFVEVETPILTHQATGALARPFTTFHNVLDLELNLRIATELPLKQLIIGGLERVFELGRIFRNEGIDSTHSPEFTTLECYQAFADYGDMMDLIQDVIAAVTREVTGSTRITYQGRELDLAPPYPRVPMLELLSSRLDREVPSDISRDDAAAIAAEHGVEILDRWGPGAILLELFEKLVEDSLWDPVFIIDLPLEVSPLTRRHRVDPNLAERFNLFVAGAEFVDAFSELIDADEQRERFLAQVAARDAGDDEAHPVDEDFLLSLEYGLPPTGGLGLGIDRLVMLLTDQTHLREVILFPTLRPIGENT